MVNPFLPYDEELWVQHLSDTHTLLLNKFNLVEHHTIVVTRTFQSQDEPLTEADLAATKTVVDVRPFSLPLPIPLACVACVPFLTPTRHVAPPRVSSPCHRHRFRPSSRLAAS